MEEQNNQPAESTKLPKWSIAIMVMLAISVAGLGYAVWAVNQKNADVAEQKTALQGQNADLQKQLDDVKAKTTAITASATTKEDVAKAYELQLAPGTKLDDITLRVAQTEGDFVRFSVGIKGQPGGSAIVVKKVGTVWIPVHNGQDTPGKETGEYYNMPKGWYSTEY